MSSVSQLDTACVLIAGFGDEPLGWWPDEGPMGSIRPVIVSGQGDAMRAARRENPDLAVVNGDSDGGQGMILVSLLKELFPRVMVIVTGRGQRVDEEAEAYASGAALYLPQPLDARELARVIACCLDRVGKLPTTSPA